MHRRLSIIAGGGQLVIEAINAAVSKGWEVQVVSLSSRDDLEKWNPIKASISHPIKVISTVRSFKPSHFCLVGGLNISDKDRKGLFALGNKKKGSVRSSGDSNLSSAVGILGFLLGAKVIGVQELDVGLLAGSGLIAGPKIGSRLKGGCLYAIEMAKKIGTLDLGQAVVCCDRRVVSVEDIAGTDALIKRVSEHVASGLTGGKGHPLILAKAKKPGQSSVVDLPAIGPDTVTVAHQAGIAVIAVEADATLLIDRKNLCARADEYGVSIFGVTPNP